jgi:hypothetical protein
MNAAGLLTASPVQMAQQSPPDAAAPDAAGDFTAALAAASMEELEETTPDEAPAAAMALLAGMFSGEGRPPEPPAAAAEGGDDAACGTGILAADQAAPRAAMSPLVLLRAQVATVSRDAMPVGEGDVAAALLGGDSAAAAEAKPASGSMGDRLIGALLDRSSGQISVPDNNSRLLEGPALYANTRETVASTAGSVSTLPEAVRTAVGQPRWANELGSHLVTMSLRGQQEGSLSLTPEHLGPLEVRISVSQDTTNVWFGAQHADTRAALTEALPRLREMFAASGLSLGQAGVSHDMPRQEARSGDVRSGTGSPGSESPDVAAVTAPVRRMRSGLLDAWA